MRRHSHAWFYELDCLLRFISLFWVIFYFKLLNRLLVSSCRLFHNALSLLIRFILSLLGWNSKCWRQWAFLRSYFRRIKVKVSYWWSYLLTLALVLTFYIKRGLGRLHRKKLGHWAFLFWWQDTFLPILLAAERLWHVDFNLLLVKLFYILYFFLKRLRLIILLYIGASYRVSRRHIVVTWYCLWLKWWRRCSMIAAVA